MRWAVDSLDSGTATDEDIVTDQSHLAVTQARLRKVERILNSLPEYAGTEARRAEQFPCYTDSGDLFQPRVLRSWSLKGGRPEEIAPAIVADLSTLGWAVSAVNRFGYRELSFDSGDGWAVSGSLFAIVEQDAVEEQDSVQVEIGIRDAEPCRLPERFFR